MKKASTLLSSLAAFLAFSGVAESVYGNSSLAERPSYSRSSDALVYHGKLVRPDDSPVNGTLNLTVEIYSPEPSVCLLWAETQTVSALNGGFSVEIGYTQNRRVGPQGGASSSFREVFINNPGLVTGSASCNQGTSYNPGVADDRLMKATFIDGGQIITIERIPIKSVPFAKQAQEIGGYGINNLVKVSGAGSASVVLTPDELTALKAFSTGAPLTMGTGDQILGVKADGSAVEYKTLSAGSGITLNHSAGGIQINAITGGVGTVTSVGVSGLPLSVADSSSTPTISIAQAGGSQAGYLSASDWNAFNSKLGSINAGMVNSALGFTPQAAGAYLTSISGAQVSAALGYTPISPTLSSGQVLVGNVSNIASARALNILDIRSTQGANPSWLNASGACSAGQTLSYNSISDRLECVGFNLTAAQIDGALGYTPVNRAGDTMTGSLALPTNGLSVGSNQLVVSGGNVGLGISSFGTVGNIQASGILGIAPNGSIRQNTNSDGGALSIYGTQFVAGATNSASYSYSGGGLIASRGNGDGAILLDVGRQSGSASFKVTNSTSSQVNMALTDSAGNTVLHASTGTGNLGIGTSNPSRKLEINTGNGTSSTSALGIFSGAAGAGSADLYFASNTTPQLAFTGSAIGNGGTLEFRNNSSDRTGILGDTFVGHHNFSSKDNFQVGIDSDGNGTGEFEIAKNNGWGGRIGIDGTSLLKVTNSGNLGIGTATPGAKLEVAGQVKITGGSPGAGKVLQSDADGLASWATLGGSESTAVSNVGSAGVGLYKQMTGSTVELKNINSAGSPITVTNDAGNNEVDVGISQANSSTPGFLSAADWQTFNNKQPAGAYLTGINATQVRGALGYTPLSETLASNQVFLGNGSNIATASWFGIGQMRNNIGTAQFPTSCTSSQTLTWSAVTDVLSCTNIDSLPASAITSGTIDSARLPFGAGLWQDGGSGRIHYSSGNVGIGTTSPMSKVEAVYSSTSTSGFDAPSGVFAVDANPSSPSSARFTGLRGIVTSASSSNLSSATIFGVEATGRHNVGGTLSQATGVLGSLQNLGSGTISTAMAVRAAVASTSTGTMTNAYGVNVSAPSVSGGGSIGTYYGVYVQTPTAASTNYALYSQGGSNYFGGNVGIGTTSPAQKLEVLGAIRSSSGATTAGMGKLIMTDGGSANSLATIQGHPSGEGMIFSGLADGEVNPEMVLLNGNLGIGTTSPGQKLSVGGGVEIDTSNLNTGTIANSLRFGGSSGEGIASKRTVGGNQYGLDFFTNSTSKMSIAWGGNVGIGTTNPLSKLQVAGDASFSLNTVLSSNIYYDYGGSQWRYHANGVGGAIKMTEALGDAGMTFLVFPANASGAGATGTALNAMTIAPSGNIAIGAATGAEKLYVHGNITNGGFDFNLGKFDQVSRGNSGASRALVKGGGNVLVANYDGDFTGGFVVAGATGTTNLFVSAAGGGSTAIGHTGPSYKLHVAGQVAGSGAYVNTSDARLKTAIKTIESPLEKIDLLRGVHFKWKKDLPVPYNQDIENDIGVIAQEVEQVFPEAVTQDKQGIKSVGYSKLIAPLIEAVKELYHKFLDQQGEIHHLKSEVQTLKEQNESLREAVCEINPKAKACLAESQ